MMAVGTAFVLLAAFSAAAPAAEAPPLLWQVPGGSNAAGSGAGEMATPAGVAYAPGSGHIYVADWGNNRVDEFDPWGTFVKAWGWGVRDGKEELQTCTTGTGCLAGIQGTGPGQFTGLRAVAVDPVSGDIYTFEESRSEFSEPSNLRVQKFSPEGEFLLMVGGVVEQDPLHPANLCTAQHLGEGESCGAGAAGEEPGAFDNRQRDDRWPTNLAVGPDRTLYVGDKGRVQEFEPDGSYRGEIPLPADEEERSVQGLAVDPNSGTLYLTLVQARVYSTAEVPFIYRRAAGVWSPFAKTEFEEGPKSGSPLAGVPEELAVDREGNLYAATEFLTPDRGWKEILEYAPGGSCTLCPEDGELAIWASQSPEHGELHPTGVASGNPCGMTGEDVYVASNPRILAASDHAALSAYGPPPDATICPPPPADPEFTDLFAAAVDSEEATLRARINPHFWPDTTYHVEYGTGECASGGCTEETPPAPLGGGTTNQPVLTAPVELSGLSPATTYHYRFVAQSSGGGPVASEEGSFTTFAPPLGPPPPCPNDAYRAGPGARLPDCRAYELVSPVDKDGGDVLVVADSNGYQAGFEQSAVSGDALTYSAYRAFADPASAPYSSQYLARRGAEGWSSASISPPRGPTPILGEQFSLQSSFRAFGADLCQGWLMHDVDPLLAPGAIPHYANLYRADLCGGGGYEALTAGILTPDLLPAEFVSELQGTSADGAVAVFKTDARLTPEGPPGGWEVWQLYRSEAGELSFLSVRPDGSACPFKASVGSATEPDGTYTRTESVWHALSEDGSRTYWSCGTGPNSKLYLRVEGEAVSRPVSGTATNGSAFFWGASPDGGRALFTSDDRRLFRYEADEETSGQIAAKVDGVLADSEDLSRVYLLSREGADGGSEGDHNLYLAEEGEPLRFIAALPAADAARATGSQATSPVNEQAVKHAAEATADGLRLAFSSTAPLSGFDNTDARSGKPATELFYYDAATDRLSCASCNPTGARPSGADVQLGSGEFWVGAYLAPTDSQLYRPRSLSADGQRLFFTSFDRLVPGDVNGMADVYEFSPAADEAACRARGAEVYSAAEGGCLSLLSSGADDKDSEFLDADPTGRDAFLRTGGSLVAWDPGQIDIYDARIGGGFAPPPSPPVECEGDSCQPAAAPPAQSSPGSAVPKPQGNPTHRPRCPKGRRAVRRHGRWVCAKKHKGGKHSKKHPTNHKQKRTTR